MIKKYLFIFIIFLFSIGSVFSDFTADSESKVMGMTIPSKVWVSAEGKIRVETTFQGQSSIVITDFVEGVLYILTPATKTYMEIRGEQAQNYNDPEYLETLEGKAQKSNEGKEVVSGYNCNVIQYTFNDPSAGVLILWYSNKLKHNLRMKMEGGATPMEMVYSNIKEGAVDSSLFNIPSDYSKMGQ
jgi:hypothetical protein